jgi:hypothetical protein
MTHFSFATWIFRFGGNLGFRILIFASINWVLLDSKKQTFFFFSSSLNFSSLKKPLKLTGYLHVFNFKSTASGISSVSFFNNFNSKCTKNFDVEFVRYNKKF